MGRAARGLCNITYECVSTPAEGRRPYALGQAALPVTEGTHAPKQTPTGGDPYSVVAL
jgi:hypothetical protein